jgi:hypothetical protein
VIKSTARLIQCFRSHRGRSSTSPLLLGSSLPANPLRLRTHSNAHLVACGVSEVSRQIKYEEPRGVGLGRETLHDVRERTSMPSRQLMQPSAASSKAGAGSQTNTFQRDIQKPCMKDDFDSLNGQTQRGYELPLTPISAEKFVLDAMSMTVGANKGARSKHYTRATEADVVDNVKLSNKNAASTLQAQSEDVFFLTFEDVIPYTNQTKSTYLRKSRSGNDPLFGIWL